jgi:hypothetical protein
MRSAIIAAIVSAIIAAPAGFAIGSAPAGELELEARVAQLEEDGRGYNAGIVALTRCVRSGRGYGYGRARLMSHPMMGQCVDDWFEANGRAYGVDW